MNKAGWQAQALGPAQWSLMRAAPPHTLKLLQGAKSLDFAREWRSRRPDGVLVLRYVTTDKEPLSELPGLTATALREFDGFQAVGGRVVLEVPVNERFHTTPDDFAALAEASVIAAATIKKAGFIPGCLVTSEGNPPGDNYGAGFFLQPRVLEAMLSFRAMGAVWCPHGYSHPPAASDDEFHATRPARILAQLPEPARLNYLYAESGCDGGTDQPNKRPGRGWKDYFASAGAYAAWYRAKSHSIALDPLCVGAALFLSGFFDVAWQSFDVADEVDLRWIFAEDVPGPPIAWLQPGGGPTVPDVILSAPERHSHAVDGNWGKGETFGPSVGVELHSTASPVDHSLENEYVGTINWFQNPDAGVSAQRVVGAGVFAEVNTSVHDREVAYHGRDPDNHRRHSIEFAHPDTPAWNARPYPDEQYEMAGELIARWTIADDARGEHWPIRLLSRAELAANPSAPGLCYHRDTPRGIADGKSDPTGPFDGPRLVAAAIRWYAKLTGGLPVPPTPTVDIVKERDALWASADRLEKAGWSWLAQAIKAAVALSKGER